MSTKTITRTILGAMLQTNNLLGKPHVVLANTTMNEKFGILASETLNPGEVPSIKCLVAGNGGHSLIVGADSIPYTSPKQHRCTDFALFNHIPWAMRDIVAGEDVTSGTFTKSRYCLRREETHASVLYAVYYGIRLDNINEVLPAMKHIVIEGGDITSEVVFLPEPANLSPVAPDPINESITVTSADYIAVSAILELLLTPDDIAELKNMALIKYGNEEMAVISEIGVCTAVDKVVPASFPAFTDVKACQIFSHLVTYHAAANMNNGLENDLELGATEPLLAISNA